MSFCVCSNNPFTIINPAPNLCSQVDCSVRKRLLHNRGAQIRQILVLSVLQGSTSGLGLAASLSTSPAWLWPAFHACAGLLGVGVATALLAPACCCCCGCRECPLLVAHAHSFSRFHARRSKSSVNPGALLASPSPSMQLLVSPQPQPV